MFKNLYRTSHDTREAKAKAMSILSKTRLGTRTSIIRETAHKVVKFIVNVKLVEKRVYKLVGRVRVVKVKSQYRSPGRKLAMSMRKLPSAASHVADV